jgi:anti-anti-sigma factor
MLDTTYLRYTASLYFLSGELDLASEDDLEGFLSDAMADGGPVTVDMSAVTFMDSTAIEVFLRILSTAPSGCLVLHGVKRSILRTMEIMGVDAISGLHVHPCVERDPFPMGRALLGPEGSKEAIQALAETRKRYDSVIDLRNASTQPDAVTQPRT